MAKTNRRNSKQKTDSPRKSSARTPGEKSGEDGSDEQEPAPVTLKPLLGIAPGYYVSALLAVGVFLFLFVLLYVPGLRSPYRDVSIESSPAGAEVRYDGTRIASTPDTVSLPRGAQTVTLSRPGFSEKELEIDVPTRRFATLFVPATTTAQAVLSPRRGLTESVMDNTGDLQALPAPGGETDTLNALFADAGNELSTWAEIGESTSRRPLPPVLSTLAEDLIAIIADTAASDASTAEYQAVRHQDFLLSSIQNVTSHAMARDLAHAAWRASSATGAPSGLSASQIVHNFIHAYTNSEGFAAWLEGVVESEHSSDIRNAAFYERFLEDNQGLDSEYSEILSEAARALETGADGVGEQIVIDPESTALTLMRVPEGTVLLGYSEALGRNDSRATRMLQNVEPFYMSQTPVTRADWKAFVEDNPDWHPDNRETLIEAGLVDSGYLATGFEGGSQETPVTDVSFHAATAFASWADEIAGDSWRVSLPSEAQWAHAAGLDRHGQDDTALEFGSSSGARPLTHTSGRAGNLGLVDILGNVWEWTSTPYYSADTVVRLAPEYAGKGFPNAAVVRGGSWANAPGEIEIESRGGQRMNWATPFLGFRLVAEETGD